MDGREYRSQPSRIAGDRGRDIRAVVAEIRNQDALVQQLEGLTEIIWQKRLPAAFARPEQLAGCPPDHPLAPEIGRYCRKKWRVCREVGIQPMSDHERLAAFRRITVKRGATKAEAATAKRLADELEAKIGKKPRARRRKGQTTALPEPPAGRWRLIWGNRLDGALGWAEWLHMLTTPLLLVLLFLPTAVIAIDFLTGHKFIPEDQILTVFLIKYGVLSALTVLAGIILGPIIFARWWIRSWHSERLRPVLIFLIEHVPEFAIMAACIGLSAYLEDRLKWPTLLALAATFAVMFALGFPWWRWVYPAIERTLLRASHGALKAAVAMLAIAVTVSIASGVWVKVYAW
jgi:hypothetical protein